MLQIVTNFNEKTKTLFRSKVSSAEPSANLYVYVGSSDLGKMTKFPVKTVTPHEKYNFITTGNLFCSNNLILK